MQGRNRTRGRNSSSIGTYVERSKDGKIIAEVDIAVSETVNVWGKYANKML